MRSKLSLSRGLLALALAACGTKSPPSGGVPAVTAAPSGTTADVAAPPVGEPGAAKPSAPIELALVANPVAGTSAVDRFELVLTATPRRDVERVELAIDGRPAVVASATAGAASEARATVEIAHGTGRDVIATAVVFVDGKRMGAAASVRVGEPAAARPTTTFTLPDGTKVEEVRP
jgi:hypothetical protein